MLASAKSNESRSAPLISDMDHLEIAITKLQEMLERISKYVDSVVVSHYSGMERVETDIDMV